MNASEMLKYVGKRGLLRDGGLRYQVEIKDARSQFGRIDLLVIPVNGSGEEWRSAENINMEGQN